MTFPTRSCFSWGNGRTVGRMEAHSALLALLLIWAVAKLAAEVMQRVGQTAVLGELLAGVLSSFCSRWGLNRTSEIS